MLGMLPRNREYVFILLYLELSNIFLDYVYIVHGNVIRYILLNYTAQFARGKRDSLGYARRGRALRAIAGRLSDSRTSMATHNQAHLRYQGNRRWTGGLMARKRRAYGKRKRAGAENGRTSHGAARRLTQPFSSRGIEARRISITIGREG